MNVTEILALRNLRGVGDRSLSKLIKAFPNQPLWPPRPDEWLRARLITPEAAMALGSKSDLDVSLERARQMLQRAERMGIRVLCVLDAEYPYPLRFLQDAPPLLYVKGNLPVMPKSVAVIGTREPTHFGVKVAKLTSTHLARAGWIVTAGLAKGIDSVAHQAAIDAGGKTVAVLATGLDSIYPKENAGLAERILETGGALVSEQDLGVRVSAFNLVQRDRLQSGLSMGTVVCETDVNGGSMHTARFTREQGRLLFCPVPKPPFDSHPKSRGLSLLLSTGALPVDGRENIQSVVERCNQLWETLRRTEPSTKPITVQATLPEASRLPDSVSGDTQSPDSPGTLSAPPDEPVTAKSEYRHHLASTRPPLKTIELGNLSVEWDSLANSYHVGLKDHETSHPIEIRDLGLKGYLSVAAEVDASGLVVGLMIRLALPENSTESPD